MKKIVLLAAAVFMIAFNSKAQNSETDARENFVIGFKVGTNYSNVYDEQGEDFVADSKFGLAAGGFMSIPLGKYLGVQPEVLFSQKGFEGTGTILGSGYSFTRTTNFIDVPLFISLKPSEFINILAGPQYSFLMKQTDVFANGVTTIEQEKEFENEDIRKNTLGFVIGADINLEHMVLSARSGWDVRNNHSDGLNKLAVGGGFDGS
jgi:hypothetical protein